MFRRGSRTWIIAETLRFLNAQGVVAVEFNEDDAPAIGRAIYQEKIRPTLGPECKGKVVVIDVKSGDYEIADRHLDADNELRKRRPDAFTWEEWVDVPNTYRIHPSVVTKPLRL